MAYNYWTNLSIEFATQRNYLDELFRVYPISPNLRREVPRDKEEQIRNAFNNRDNRTLLMELLDWELFPIKDSYVPFLRRDRSAIDRNPNTVNRIAGNLYAIGYEEMFEKMTEPKETNRQIGPMFKNWIDRGTLGITVVRDERTFLEGNEPMIYNVSDEEMKRFANAYLGYNREKGLDFLAKINGKYVIAEAKFLTDFGGHQNAQFQDAIDTLHTQLDNPQVEEEIIQIIIADGVVFLNADNKFNKYLRENEDEVIISSLLLREYLFSIWGNYGIRL